jgi:ActR/RegA family two-component response regulator
MDQAVKLLFVDADEDSRVLLGRTLIRKFPHSVILDAPNLADALELAGKHEIHAAVVHRAVEHDGATVVRALRDRLPSTVILMVSGFGREKEAQSAGADDFVMRDEWLRVGTVLQELLAKKRAQAR